MSRTVKPLPSMGRAGGLPGADRSRRGRLQRWVPGAIVELGRRIRRLLDRRREDEEMDEELRFHLEMEAAQYARSGMSDEDARRTATLAFGGIDAHREEIREARGLPPLEDFWRDVKYAGRSFWRDRNFTIIAIAILGVGLGIGSGVMAFINYAAFEPLPGIQQPEEVARIEFLHRASWGTSRSVGGDERIAYLDAQTSFATVGALAIRAGDLPADLGDRVENVTADVILGHYFEALRLDMTMGRGLVGGSTEDDQAVVLSHDLWKTHFESSPNVLGRVIRLNGFPTEVIGVGPEGFPSQGDLWLTSRGANLRMAAGYETDDADQSSKDLVGRLKPGVTRAQAAAEASAIASTFAEILVLDEYDLPVYGAQVGPPTIISWQESLPAVALLGGLTLLLLAVVCANLGVLLLGRALARRQEISVRIALGASRKRLFRQLLTEGIVLALLGSVVAIVGIAATSRLTLTLQGLEMTLVPSWQTSLLTIGLAAVVGVVFSVAPALHTTLGSIRSAMSDSAGAGSRRGVRLQRGLVVGAFSLASGLASVAGLIIVWVFQTTGPTSRAEVSEQVTVITTRPRSLGYVQRQVPELAERFGGQLLRLPGVESVSYAYLPPEFSEGYGIHVPGMTEEYDPRASPTILREYAGPGYFGTLGIPLLAGREFLPSDDAGVPQSVIVGKEIADRLWPGLDAVGRTLEFERVNGDERAPDQALIVGVTGARGRRPYSPGPGGESVGRPIVYFPVAQRQDYQDQPAQLSLFVRTRDDAGPAMMTAVRASLLAVEPELVIYDIQTTRERHWEQNEQELMSAYAAAIGGTVILLIAAVGVYGVITFRLNQRRREVAITRALGAREGQVVFGSFREGMALSLTGMALGLLVSFLLVRLFFVGALQLGAIAIVTGTLTTAAAIACWLPARRAARIQPMEALRV